MVPELDLQQIRKILVSERQQLLHSLAEQESLQPALDNLDENELANLYESQEVRSSLDELSAQILDRINLALERLKQGTYGVCLECKAPIPGERLMALPYAELCVACQVRLERKGKKAWTSITGT